jgi:hypothetical protein
MRSIYGGIFSHVCDREKCFVGLGYVFRQDSRREVNCEWSLPALKQVELDAWREPFCYRTRNEMEFTMFYACVDVSLCWGILPEE